MENILFFNKDNGFKVVVNHTYDDKPMIVIFPGGGYHHLSTREAIPVSNKFLSLGYNTTIDLLKEQYQLINDGQKIVLNDLTIKVLATPGHTNCSICLIIEDMMFSGDTLFECGVGRSDLPTGSSIQLSKSIQMLLNLKTDYIVYPGHGDKTSIFSEVKINPYYQRIK